MKLPDVHRFDGPAHGPHLLVLGGIHGNELCGQIAGREFVEQLESGLLKLKAGCVTVVPVCNPEAAARGIRQIDANLNRVFRPHDRPELYEEHLANILCPLVGQADYILDLHSTTAPTPPYVFLDYDDKVSRGWLGQLGIAYAVTGWPALHQEAGEDCSTQEYAHRLKRTALTVECGQHDEAGARDTARNAILSSLAHFGLADVAMQALASPAYVRLEQVYYKEQPGRFARPWQNFSPVEGGEILAAYEDGTMLKAPAPGHVLLPHENAPIGEDWLYFAAAAR